MKNVLNIAEKNSVAKQVARHLSKGSSSLGRTVSKYNPVYEFQIPEMRYKMRVSSVRGHVIQYDFPQQYKKNWKMHNPRIFFKQIECLIQPNDDMGDLVDNLKSLARNIDMLVLWLDCDREGEAIAFEVVDIIRSVAPKVEIKRARFSAVTNQDVWSAFQNLVEPNKYEADAVNYRREVDLRLGVSFTRIQTLTLQHSSVIQGTVSYGPCQFPTLGFVVQRYLKVKNFISEKFWIIKAFYINEATKERIEFKWKRVRLYCELSTNILYLNMIESFQGNKPIARVIRENKNNRTKFKPYPLATIQLQKIGTDKLKMSSQKIMDLAQKLYQKGFISYPRTQTTSYTHTMDLLKFIRGFQQNGAYQQYASKLLNQDKFLKPRNGNKNDQAHPPIHPVKAATREQLTQEQWRVYDLISRHFLASCSKDAQAQQRVVQIMIGQQQFSATHLTITAYNFLEIYTFQKWTQSTIPSIPEQFYPICSVDFSQTSPPNYLTEAQLIGVMDKNQIGTDSTIHQHIRTIQQRSYATKTNNSFKPTPLGLALVLSYNTMGIQLSNCWVRRNIEINMNEIVAQRLSRQDAVLRTIQEMMPIYDKLCELKNQWVGLMRIHLPEEQSEVMIGDRINCVRCGRQMRLQGGCLVCDTCNTKFNLPSGSYTKTDFKCPICGYWVLEVIKKRKKFPDNLCPMCYNNPPPQYKSDRNITLMECDNCTYDCPKARGAIKKELFSCPVCKNKVILKSSGTGKKFLGCGTWPACTWGQSFMQFVKSVRITGESCQKCEQETMCGWIIDERLVDNMEILIKLTQKTSDQIIFCINPNCSPFLFQEERVGQKSEPSLKTNSSKQINCYRCKQDGHYANNCSNPKNQSKDLKKVSRTHSEDSTTFKSNNNNKNNNKRTSFVKNKGKDAFKLTCYKCQKQGHIAPNCPQKNQKPVFTNPSSNPNSKGCSFCGVIGRHLKGSECVGLKRNRSRE